MLPKPATAVAEHPMMAPLAQAVKATLALVRPVSWVFVAHRLLGALVPIVWLRAVVELLVMPFLVDSSLAGNVRDSVWTPCTDQADSDVSDGLLIDVLATSMPRSTNGSAPGLNQFDDEEPPLNRASRRAQQRDDAQARRCLLYTSDAADE